MGKFLVTGCAGFIGAALAGRLLGTGHRVVGIDNLNEAYDVRLKQLHLQSLKEYSDFKFIRGDIAELGMHLEKESEAIDAVFHLAARAGVRQSFEDPHAYVRDNVHGTVEVLEFCRRRSIEHLVFASSSSVYGNAGDIPCAEEMVSSGALSPYAASKRSCELFCASHARRYGLHVTILRYFTVYGPAGRPDMGMFRFVQGISEGTEITLLGDGSQRRDFTFVEDIVSGTIASLNLSGFHAINLGSGSPITVSAAIETISLEVGRKARIRGVPRDTADALSTWADINKAKKLLQWQPQVSFTEGVSALISWYSEHRDLAAQL